MVTHRNSFLFRLTAPSIPLLVALAMVASLVAAVAPGQAEPASGQTPGGTSIAEENQQPGSRGWFIKKRGSDAGMEIEGFMSASSINVGESIDYHISVSVPQDVTIEVYRMGWYDGAGARLMTTIGPLAGQTKAAPVVDPVTGAVTTDWSADQTLQVPSDWTTGVYLSRLVRADGYNAHTIFVLRDDDHQADFVVQIPITTYQAYNGFPADGATGKSLYGYNSFGPAPTGGDGALRAIEVSFDRPYDKDGAGQYFLYDHGVVTFLEREGYEVAYVTNLDPVDPQQHPNLEGFISSGHDEYWSSSMYDQAENLRDSGVDLAFLGANAVYWRIDMAPSTLDGRADRVMVAPKDYNADRWREAGRPEQQLVGVQYKGPFSSNYTPLIVQNADNWVWANTGLRNGDEIPDMAGYEIDTVFPEYPGPPGPQTLLTASPFQGNTQNTSIYQASSDAWVFGSGTINWNRGLGHPFYPQEERAPIQQATRNLLARFADDDWNTHCEGKPITVRLDRGEQPTAGNDVILGTWGPDTIDGLGGNDLICALGGDDTITGGDGNDKINGGDGDDTITGGDGKDTINGDGGDDAITGDGGADKLNGGDGDDTIDGGVGKDTVDGGADNDTITGGVDNDKLDGGAGDDTIDGGDQNDRINGGDGDDQLSGGKGLDTVNGDADNDTIDGGPDDDTLNGGDGDDMIDGAGGKDRMNGGDGNDTMNGGDGRDTMNGNAGDDDMTGGDDDDRMIGDDGNDRLDAGKGDDNLSAGDGDDVLIGGDANDRMNGGDGDDTIDGNAGNDDIKGGNGADVMTGGPGNDKLNGGNDPDDLAGDEGEDSLIGGNGDDTLDGGPGKDSLNGGAGDDTCTSGGGDDTFRSC